MITADHGGHGRVHGTDLDEDMKIPLFIGGNVGNLSGKWNNPTILDIAPTVAKLFGLSPNREWEGEALCQ